MKAEKLSTLFCGLWRDTGGDLDECLRAVYELGKSSAEATARKRAHQATLNERYRVEAKRCAELLRRRWNWLFDAVAGRNGTTADRLLEWKGRDHLERRGTDELAWLLREVAGLDFVKLGALLGRHHSTVYSAVDRVQTRIGLMPGYRDELLSIAIEAPVPTRRAA